MKLLKNTSIITCLFFCAISTAQAAQDYNSSRSNTTSAVEAPDLTDKILRDISEDASSVAKSMIAIDQKDGYSGKYVVSVDVRVSIERDRPPVIKEIKKRM